MFKTFIPPQTDGMIRFSFNIGFSESKVIFKRRKKSNMSNKNALQGVNVRTLCTSLRTQATNKHSQHTEKPAFSLPISFSEAAIFLVSDGDFSSAWQKGPLEVVSLRQGMRRSLGRTFFRPEREAWQKMAKKLPDRREKVPDNFSTKILCFLRRSRNISDSWD